MKRAILALLLVPAIIFSQTEYRFFINNINMPINNRGVLGDVNIPPDGTLGRFDGIGFLFSGGFWLSGYNDDSLWANGMTTASLIDNYIQVTLIQISLIQGTIYTLYPIPAT